MAHLLTTSIEIDAAPEAVWGVLADLGRYPDWNPHVVEASGTLAAGERLRLRMGGMRFRPRVLRADGRELRWLGHLGVPGLFDGEHRFTLTPLPGGGTRLEQAERFTGALVPLTGRLLERTRGDFEAVNAALKARAEAAAA
ncbi:MAG: SRPBCC domain-containing protein [Solirubrobacterales bacterium]|nr:SRPBCC domain-containing protein [Solirubrobacterales bacterium]